jgi:hypothetical protein
MGREIRELERALVGQSNKGTYQFIYDQNQRILHHWQSASLALQILDSQFGIKTGKMHDYIYTHATEYMNSFLNPRLLEDSVGFLERQGHGADFIRDKYNLCPLDSSLITDCEEVAA